MKSVNLTQAVDILKSGGLLAIPTETVYGLAGNALDETVVLQVFKVKNRPAFDPMILHIPEISHLEKYAFDSPDVVYKLATAFWPGPLTILLRKKDIVPDIVTSGSDMAGFRIPNHALTLQLLQQLDFPLAAPSANPFGYISPTTAAHVDTQLGDKIDGLLDGGPCSVGIESTVIQIENQSIIILRKGGISETQLEEVTAMPVYFMQEDAHPTAPGMLKSHYAPSKPFKLSMPHNPLDSTTYAWIRYSEFYPEYPRNSQYILSEESNLHEAAQRLFALMRKLDEDPNIKIIFADLVPETGIGRAINDKLRKAAARHS